MRYALNAMSKFIPVMKNAKLNLWRAVYIERCTYGFGARLWKPTLETRQGAVVLAYNLQREHIKPSEKAFAYKMKMDAMKHQGASSQLGTKQRTDALIAAQTNESRNQVQRYIRLTNLIPGILKLVDEQRMALTPAVEISYLTEDEQYDLLETMECEDRTPSLSQAQELKRLSQDGLLDIDRIFDILRQPKGNQQDKLILRIDEIRKYFPSGYSALQMGQEIFRLLEDHRSRTIRQRDRDER